MRGLLLGQGIKETVRFHQPQKNYAVRCVKMVRLSAYAHQAESTEKMFDRNRLQLKGDYGDSLIPTDWFKSSVGFAFGRMAQVVAMVNLVVNAKAFIADVAV
jgi:hypothetical protein